MNSLNQIEKGSQWLDGEGAGAWFHLSKPVGEPLSGKQFRIKRFSEEGELECDRVFEVVNSENFYIDKPFQFTHISHCEKCSVIQNGKVFIFKYLLEE